MQREVLNRSVSCDGVVFDAGTPIELIPVANRESCQRSGWTRVEEITAEDAEELKRRDAENAEVVAWKVVAVKVVEEKVDVPVVEAVVAEVAVVEAVVAEVPVVDVPVLLASSSLDSRVIELLQAVAITTKQQAREYLVSNKTFRTIEGIGKASDAAIRAVIEN